MVNNKARAKRELYFTILGNYSNIHIERKYIFAYLMFFGDPCCSQLPYLFVDNKELLKVLR